MYRINETAISWLPPEQIERAAMQQIVKLASMPFIYKHVAVMPDCHVGMGATVGSCIPTDGAIIPAAVGVDIGCGMVAVRTPLTRGDLPADLSGIRGGYRAAHSAQRGQVRPSFVGNGGASCRRTGGEGRGQTARLQETSLGEWTGGVSLARSVRATTSSRPRLTRSGGVWTFLHSGSRGIGNRIATHHIGIAQRLMKEQSIKLPDRDLAYLSEGTEEFDDYIHDLRWAQDFALFNREEMMDRVMTEPQLHDVRRGRSRGQA